MEYDTVLVSGRHANSACTPFRVRSLPVSGSQHPAIPRICNRFANSRDESVKRKVREESKAVEAELDVVVIQRRGAEHHLCPHARQVRASRRADVWRRRDTEAIAQKGEWVKTG